jgi:TonB-linked SusC/RagA family outer membrane protein
MRKVVLLSSLVFCFALQVLAQGSKKISGKIVDQKTKQGLGGVTVNAGKVNALSDANGNYQINVTDQKSLSFSIIGYAKLSRTIGAATTINVELASVTAELEEVVITGYARESKSKFAGAVTTISGKTVNDVPVGSFDQAFQGRVPGMLVNSGSGQPGSSAVITIRGIKSLQGAGAQPLYVLDGVPIPAFDMQTLNPDDFESITVLKDATAAAIYGARGGTGVIVITSKRGKTGKNIVTYKTQYGITRRPNFDRLNMMNTREMLAYEEREKIVNNPGWTWSPNNPAIPAGMTAASKARSLDSLRNIDIDYADIFYREGISKSHELTLSGGSDRTKFFLSGAYFDQEGIDIYSSLKRYTLRFNLDHSTDKFTAQFNSTVGFSKTQQSEGEAQGNSTRNPFQMTFRAKTYENPYNLDGSLNFGANSTMALKNVANLLEGLQNTSRVFDQIKLVGNGLLAYKILPTLTVRNNLGVTSSTNFVRRYVNPNSFVGSLQSFQSGVTQESGGLYTEFINTSSVAYSERFGKSELEASANFEVVRGFQRALGFTLFNLDKRLTETGQGAGPLPTNGAATYPQNASSAKSGFGIRSYFATTKYTYDNKYSLNANIRRDGTSRIVNEENREVTSWSAGFTWNALNERFLSKQSIFSELKLRLSFGIIPNIGSIQTAAYGAGLQSVTNYQGPQVPSFGTTQYAGSTLTGLAPTGPGNPNLKIERVQKSNIGIDFSVWNGRARFNLDAYDEQTLDLFVNQPLSGTTGFSSLYINAGRMSNKGLELNAKVDVIRNRDFGVTLGLNHSYNKNTIENLGAVNEFFLGTFVIRKGLSYGTHYTLNYLGVDPATGNPRYEAPDGSITNDQAKAGQFDKFGNYLPRHQGGVDFEIRYKAFSISGLFSYQFEVQRYNNIKSWITRGIPGYQSAVRASRELIDNQWTAPGDNKRYQRSGVDRGFTSDDIEDAKFIRFRNLVVAYQLPALKGPNGKPLFTGGRLYAQGQNLAIWSPWTGLDPEDSNNISLSEYPNPSMFTLGLDINF